jgi:hypothetical protein
MTDPTGSRQQIISGGTGVALSLALSLFVAAFNAGGTYVVVARLQSDVSALQAAMAASTSVQHAQALELATLKTELRAIRDGMTRVEAALDRLSPSVAPASHRRP